MSRGGKGRKAKELVFSEHVVAIGKQKGQAGSRSEASKLREETKLRESFSSSI